MSDDVLERLTKQWELFCEEDTECACSADVRFFAKAICTELGITKAVQDWNELGGGSYSHTDCDCIICGPTQVCRTLLDIAEGSE